MISVKPESLLMLREVNSDNLSIGVQHMRWLLTYRCVYKLGNVLSNKGGHWQWGCAHITPFFFNIFYFWFLSLYKANQLGTQTSVGKLQNGLVCFTYIYQIYLPYNNQQTKYDFTDCHKLTIFKEKISKYHFFVN